MTSTFVQEDMNKANAALPAAADKATACQQELALLSEEVRQFAYIVSHDLQAPLRMITGFLELLSRRYSDQLDEQAAGYISYAVNGAEKMKRLINDLLQYSRLITAHKKTGVVSLDEVLQAAVTSVTARQEGTGLHVNAGTLPAVPGDKAQLILLFEELISNAVKFRSAAMPDITVYAEREEDNWRITVSDNGIGFDPSFADKIFTVFRRLHPDESIYKGTGIGLALCKRICELHGGTVSAGSIPGQGSRFQIVLPAN